MYKNNMEKWKIKFERILEHKRSEENRNILMSLLKRIY